MKCPHCTVEIHSAFTATDVHQAVAISTEKGAQYRFKVLSMTCPACRKAILYLDKLMSGANQVVNESLVYPKQATRPKAPDEVPADLAEDFNEACLVLSDSPKASAALSRRCLQSLLRQQGYTQHDLAKAIDAVLAAKALPSALTANLDAVRNIGNFAAHPIKDTNSGAVVQVEDHEADWNLDVLEGLFDFYYVDPARNAARIVALNEKLAAAGKPPMKG